MNQNQTESKPPSVEEPRDEGLDETACSPSLEEMYQKVVAACLRCDPLPACQREDDQLETPWEVIDRIRCERDQLQQWKREAMLVLSEWEAVWVTAGSPGTIGQSKADATRKFLLENETKSDTPETDQMVATALCQLENDETCPASVYWRMVEFTRTLERERDEWVSKAVELCAERESNAMQALAYKAERDELRRWTSVNGVSDLERERDRMQELAEANGKLAHTNACEAMDYRRERDEARESLAAAESWSATLADIGDDFRATNSELRDAIRNLRDARDERHAEQARDLLFGLLMASSQPEP